MKILISNDDGYQAPGIMCLAETLSEIAEIIIVAPDRNRSGASNSLTLDSPLRVRELKENFYYVNGTPTDCVHVALTGLLRTMPDMVVSGINNGQNMGDDVLYSGTVAAAIEGRALGLPSIAVSLIGEAKHYKTAAHVAKDLVLRLMESHLPPKTILNVNVPDLLLSDLRGYEVTRLGTRHKAQHSIEAFDPRGKKVYWVGLPGSEEDAGAGTDFNAVRDRRASITPLQVEWTNYQAFEKVSSWVEGLNESLKQEDG